MLRMRAASWAASLSFFFCLPFLCWNSRKSEMPRVGVGGDGSWELAVVLRRRHFLHKTKADFYRLRSLSDKDTH